jgi:hypothetical protein
MTIATPTTFKVELDSYGDEFEYADAKDEVQLVLDSSDSAYFHIAGRNMNWTHSSGFNVIKHDKVIDSLIINGDFRIEFTLTEGLDTFSAVRYSHDEMGAGFTIRPATDDEIEDYA